MAEEKQPDQEKNEGSMDYIRSNPHCKTCEGVYHQACDDCWSEENCKAIIDYMKSHAAMIVPFETYKCLSELVMKYASQIYGKPEAIWIGVVDIHAPKE